MEKFNEHTELPWVSDSVISGSRNIIKPNDIDRDSFGWCDFEKKEDFDFMIEACNSYYKNKAKAQLFDELFAGVKAAHADEGINFILAERLYQLIKKASEALCKQS